MQRAKSLLVFSVPLLFLLGCLVLVVGPGKVASVRATTQDKGKETRAEKEKLAEEDPAHPSDYLWEESNPQLIKDEPLEVKVPAGLQPLTPGVVVPAANPITKGKYELGRQLYFDPRVSQNGTVSCATCHSPAKGWTDAAPVSTGIHGQKGGRSAPTVFNTVYGKSMFWDGRAPSLEGQAQGPMVNPIEMGAQTHRDVIDRLRTIPGYREQFAKVFGTNVTLDGAAKAIATFERVAALSGNSKYDKYYAGDNNALSESEKRGMVLFGLRLNTDDEFKAGVELQKGKCTICHVGANFTDEKYHNLGVGFDPGTGKFKDVGRWAAVPIGAKNDLDKGSFKTPTVRDIALTGPYMHDGSMKTLDEVVEHYDKGGTPNPALDPDMKPLKLTSQESADLVAFMKALTGEHKSLDELLPTLPPGADGKAPDPRDALTPPSK
ncbi:MAG: cytochrome-c peroxidase [Isosphaeraceae bacterium]